MVFSLDKADGSNVVPQQAVELARDYVSVPLDSTGTQSEREMLSREMQKDMTASILRRIDAASRSPKPLEQAEPGEANPADADPAQAPAIPSPEPATTP